ncbi:MAG: alcohol dehydrogenase catalytic domain-containing protein [Streptosporangiales bacterium]|nr:alcohol dehydrogenase catalytic domain-containing protein [Streptosporangiales bacterium]
MRAAVVSEPGRLTFEDLPDPRPTPGEVVVTVAANGLCGTDLHVLDGELTLATYPVVPGHETAGTVEEVGGDVPAALRGRRVAIDPSIWCGDCVQCRVGRRNLCPRGGGYGITRDGGCASHIRVHQRNLVFLPESLPFEAASIAQPLGCALHALRRAGVGPGDTVLVVGAGAAGLLLAQAARARGAAEVAVCEPVPSRRDIAALLDLDEVGHDAAALADRHPDGFRVVVDATGHAAVTGACLDLVGLGGLLLVFGVAPPHETVPIAPAALYERELTVLGTRGMNGDLPAAIALLASGRVRWEPLVTARRRLEELPAAMDGLRRGEGVKAMMVGETDGG